MQEMGDSDRRIFERFPVKLALRYLNLHSNQEAEVETRDVCANGLCINSREHLPERTPLEIWLSIPDRGQPVYTRGEVIWSDHSGEGNYSAGIKLEKTHLMDFARVLRMLDPRKNNYFV